MSLSTQSRRPLVGRNKERGHETCSKEERTGPAVRNGRKFPWRCEWRREPEHTHEGGPDCRWAGRTHGGKRRNLLDPAPHAGERFVRQRRAVRGLGTPTPAALTAAVDPGRRLSEG